MFLIQHKQISCKQFKQKASRTVILPLLEYMSILCSIPLHRETFTDIGDQNWTQCDQMSELKAVQLSKNCPKGSVNSVFGVA